MKTLIVSFLFQNNEQGLPFFLESIKKMEPCPSKILVFDFTADKKFFELKLDLPIQVEKKTIDKDFSSQLAGLRNQALALSKKQDFGAVFFVQPNIFPPSDVLARLEYSNKDIIAPVFFIEQKQIVFSNAIKIIDENKKKFEPLLFSDFLPSGEKKVDSVSLQAVFLKKSFFEKVEFLAFNDAVDEMFFLAKKARDQNKEIFVDSSIVCAKLSQTQLFSNYYFSVQK